MVQSRSLSQTRHLATTADTAGFDWLGFPDSPAVYQDTFLHQMEALRATERVHVGPFVTHLTLRHPVTVANALSTLDEAGPGRVRAALGTGNSGATGLGIRPARLAEMQEGFACIRDWWAGRASSFRDSSLPATGLVRPSAPLLLAADGPRGAELAARIGDGLVYSGGIDSDMIRSRRQGVLPERPWELWVAPTFSLAERYEDVFDDVGAQVVAMANRALRGGPDVSGVPPELRNDVRELHERYDYGAHADAEREGNMHAASPALARYLVDRFVIWGNAQQWSSALDEIANVCDGVVFVFGHRDPHDAMSRLSERLGRLGLVNDAAV